MAIPGAITPQKDIRFFRNSADERFCPLYDNASNLFQLTAINDM